MSDELIKSVKKTRPCNDRENNAFACATLKPKQSLGSARNYSILYHITFM